MVSSPLGEQDGAVMPVACDTTAKGTSRGGTANLLWRCAVVAVAGSALAGAGNGQPEPIVVSAAVAVRPSNLTAASVFHSDLERMWRSSPTFNRQCRRLAAAARLQIVVRLEDPQRRPSFYARTVLERRGGVLVAADVFLSPTPDAVERIAHEVEHIIEQLDGVDLEAQVGSGNVWRREDGAFETRRATEAGRRVAREVTTRTGGAEPQR
jgi:hypothetical protein